MELDKASDSLHPAAIIFTLHMEPKPFHLVIICGWRPFAPRTAIRNQEPGTPFPPNPRSGLNSFSHYNTTF